MSGNGPTSQRGQNDQPAVWRREARSLLVFLHTSCAKLALDVLHIEVASVVDSHVSRMTSWVVARPVY